MKEAASEISKW